MLKNKVDKKIKKTLNIVKKDKKQGDGNFNNLKEIDKKIKKTLNIVKKDKKPCDGHFNDSEEIDKKIKKTLNIVKKDKKPCDGHFNDSEEIDKNKKIIIDMFMKNVKGKEIIIEKKNHCGSEGHWLEKQMNIKHNSKNEPDIFGYEMKKQSLKITFGDFSASEYLFSKKKEIIEEKNNWNKDENIITRNDFIKYFGTPNPLKNNRYSWSGSCVPKYGEWNSCG